MGTNHCRTDKSTVAWGEARDGLRLGLATEQQMVTVYLHNVDPDAQTVLSHVIANQFHFDWYALQLVDSQGQQRTLRFIDDRDESSPVKVRLESDACLEHVIEIVAWARRPINGAKPLDQGWHSLSATYDVSPLEGEDVWSGRLSSGEVEMTI